MHEIIVTLNDYTTPPAHIVACYRKKKKKKKKKSHLPGRFLKQAIIQV